jgi:hypothetical protein
MRQQSAGWEHSWMRQYDSHLDCRAATLVANSTLRGYSRRKSTNGCLNPVYPGQIGTGIDRSIVTTSDSPPALLLGLGQSGREP